jgi:hypothetical protein
MNNYIENRTVKKCCDCKQFLPLDSFYKNKSKWDGLAGICKCCVTKRKAANPEQANKHIRAWQKRNPDKVREAARAYRKKNKAKQRQKERGKPGYKLKRRRHEKARRLRSSAELRDDYVIDLLRDGTNLKSTDFPQELVELKRIHLKIHRQIKQQKQTKER